MLSVRTEGWARLWIPVPGVLSEIACLENLGPLDNQFFAYPDNLTDLLFAFVAKHPEEFGALPKADDE